jgi:prephenate dehydratase
MADTIAYLGPEGTYTQLAALAYSLQLEQRLSYPIQLKSFPSIPRAMQATAHNETSVTIVPVENSTEGGVSTTLDTLWRLRTLKIQQALVMPIRHGLLSTAEDLETLTVVYSHPQALSQCQLWLENHLPHASLMPTPSTTEALKHLSDNSRVAAISSEWAAQLYNLPILVHNINDNTENCTKFWVLSPEINHTGGHTSIAFSLPTNAPGSLLKPLQIFAHEHINLSRIESRPTKRSLGDYLFFIDLETNDNPRRIAQALQKLEQCTETLVNFGSYELTTVSEDLDPVMDKYHKLLQNQGG